MIPFCLKSSWKWFFRHLLQTFFIVFLYHFLPVLYTVMNYPNTWFTRSYLAQSAHKSNKIYNKIKIIWFPFPIYSVLQLPKQCLRKKMWCCLTFVCVYTSYKMRINLTSYICIYVHVYAISKLYIPHTSLIQYTIYTAVKYLARKCSCICSYINRFIGVRLSKSSKLHRLPEKQQTTRGIRQLWTYRQSHLSHSGKQTKYKLHFQHIPCQDQMEMQRLQLV